jgi:transcriptional regulator GlxA family with amidase domain
LVVLTRQAQRYQQIVDRFEQIARANIAKPASIAELCRNAAVTPRTLSRAFRAIRGMTPYRYLQQLRLSEVRRALSSGSEAKNVTEVATRFGFRELGRFSARYREAFGESPSETKRRARSVQAAPHDGPPHRSHRSGHPAA